MKTHKQFNISTSPYNVDLLSGILWQLDIEGINEDDNSLIIFAKEESNVSKSEVESLLSKMRFENLIESFAVIESNIEEVNWNEEWEKKINVIEVSDKIVIKPTFREYSPKANQLVITIDPKMSFGTGEHETTKLVLQLLDKHINNSKRVLDVGSGTGVLGIAASLLGAEHVVGIDNDEWCIENGIENIELNNVQSKVEVRLAEIDKVKDEPFDLILANINRHILIDISKSIMLLSKSNGILILSGLLYTDREDILKLYSGIGFNLVDEKRMGEWIALVFINQK
ncbi:MAG: 50S ribosomal protein L11 methyltransferase [Ignavibacteriales bacterium CG18_big_fil_WC_8_21_14_2_50_31_20]|nr:MAG: 50S ribosomal protein L11 methyltransferase [Ignavibacteriales bacterium CG18_big_fil_WC_8_21_14_2_50_31_20]